MPRSHFALFACCCALLPAFAGETAKSEASRPAFLTPVDTGLATDYRSSWKQITPLSFSGMHWNQSVIVYSNRGNDVYQHNQDLWWEQEQSSGWSGSADSGSFQGYAPGTVLIKEGFIRARKGAPLRPTFLSIMIKREKGFDPEYGDWEYLQSTPQGKVLLRGALSAPGISTACGNCHTNVADRDYVFSTTGKGG